MSGVSDKRGGRHPEFSIIATVVENFMARFWAKVKKGDGPDDCWIWTGTCLPSKSRLSPVGYGLFGTRGTGVGKLRLGPRASSGMIGAHRASWEFSYGPVPDGLLVLHRCDNPPCVRPDHLFLGTHARNAQDCVEKGRHARTAGPRKLTPIQDAEIKAQWDSGSTGASLAAKYGVSLKLIRLVVRGRKTDRRRIEAEAAAGSTEVR